jgi:hydroxylamine reductase
MGVCGKSPTISALQDLIVQYVKELSFAVLNAGKLDEFDNDIIEKVYFSFLEAMFFTLTNVNYSLERHLDVL